MTHSAGFQIKRNQNASQIYQNEEKLTNIMSRNFDFLLNLKNDDTYQLLYSFTRRFHFFKVSCRKKMFEFQLRIM